MPRVSGLTAPVVRSRELKAAHKVSFADAFLAATAQRLDATLVHKDSDFDALKGIIKLHPLPPKPGKTT